MDDDAIGQAGSHILASVSRIRTAKRAAELTVKHVPKNLWGFTYTKFPKPGEPKFLITDEVRLTAWVLFFIGCATVVGFLVADLGLGRITFHDVYTNDGHGLAVIIAGVFAFFACFLSFMQVRAHWKAWTHPPSQKLVVRILYMVPIYAISAWGSLTFLDLSSYIDFVRGVYEAFVIYTFMILLTKYLGGHNGVVEWMKYKPLQAWPSPMCFLKPVKPDSQYLYYLKYGALQYTILTPICSLAAVVLTTFGAYEDGVIRYDNGYPYVAFILNMSQLVSLYCLVWLYVCMKNELMPFGPLYKFLVVKAVVFATFWQGVGLALMAHMGWITNTDNFTVGEVQVGMQDFLVCCLTPETEVAYANGEIKTAAEVREGDELLGEAGKGVVVDKVQHLSGPVYQISTSAGNFNATGNHLLSIQWCRSPQVFIGRKEHASGVDMHFVVVAFTTFNGLRLKSHRKYIPCEQPADVSVLPVALIGDEHDDNEIISLSPMKSVPQFKPVILTSGTQCPSDDFEEDNLSVQSLERGTTAQLRAFGVSRLEDMRLKLSEQEEPQLVLARGDVFDMPVVHLIEAWNQKSFNMDDCSARQMTAVRTPLPIAVGPAARFTQFTPDSELTHTECSLLSLGVENGVTQYTALTSEALANCLVHPQIGYQLHNHPSAPSQLASSGQAASTVLNLELVHQGLDTSMKSSGLITTELNPLSSSVSELSYANVCRSNIISVLGLGLKSVVAFGEYTHQQWQSNIRSVVDPNGAVVIDAHSIEEDQIDFPHARVRVQLLRVKYTLHNEIKVCTVFFAAHPCHNILLPQVAAAIGLAHGLDQSSLQAKLSYFTPTGGYHPVFTLKPQLLHDGAPHPVVNIVCKGELESEKRYAIVADRTQGALITHNCEMFIAACVHKYTFGSETYADGSLRTIMEQRALYLAEISYQRAQEAQKEAQKLADALAEAANPALKGTKVAEKEETPEEALARKAAMAAAIRKAMDEDTEGDVLFDEDEVDWTTGYLPSPTSERATRSNAYDYVYQYELEHQRPEGVDEVALAVLEGRAMPRNATIPMTDIDFGIPMDDYPQSTDGGSEEYQPAPQDEPQSYVEYNESDIFDAAVPAPKKKQTKRPTPTPNAAATTNKAAPRSSTAAANKPAPAPTPSPPAAAATRPPPSAAVRTKVSTVQPAGNRATNTETPNGAGANGTTPTGQPPVAKKRVSAPPRKAPAPAPAADELNPFDM